MSVKILPQIPANKKNKKESYQEELEERIISIIASLFGKQASLFQCYFIYLLIYYSVWPDVFSLVMIHQNSFSAFQGWMLIYLSLFISDEYPQVFYRFVNRIS